MAKNKQSAVYEIMEQVKSDICDNYCKYPERYESDFVDSDEALDTMMEEHCDKCPLNRLM